MLSKICWPSTYLVCSFEMRFGRSGLIRLAMTLVMSLKIMLHRMIRQKACAVVALSSLGMRVRNCWVYYILCMEFDPEFD